MENGAPRTILDLNYIGIEFWEIIIKGNISDH